MHPAIESAAWLIPWLIHAVMFFTMATLTTPKEHA